MQLRGQYKLIVADPFRSYLRSPFTWAVGHPLGWAGAPDSLLILWAGLAGEALLDGSVSIWLGNWGYNPLAVHTWERVGGAELGSPPLPKLAPVGVSTSELFVIARRGNPDMGRFGQYPHLNSVHVWRAPANPAHKPDGFWRWVEEQAEGPYLAAWTNPQRQGWDTYGLQGEEP